MTSELHELQAKFAASLLDSQIRIPDAVVSHTSTVPVRRFNVYRNNVASSLIDVLQAYFPVVTRLVGEEFFRAMARVFIVQQPPRSPILSRYGGGFADFIADFEPTADVPYLADVARLEWLVLRAYHAVDLSPLTPDDLIDVPPETADRVAFELHPSAGLLSSSFPVASIWQTNTLDEQVRPVVVDDNPEDVLVLRPHHEVMVINLPPGALTFSTAIKGGSTIGEAHRRAFETCITFDLHAAIVALLGAGAFVDWRLSDQPTNSHRGAN